ncbi:MAG TPA: thiamine pyrophosphate-dependent dehydrogenase E1 component subunit alpha [Bacteroidota bacterium]|nr:thiamine pyrophosphate-dependent dehydrogenase E1 component subunit alpha [Bacteroidota bacterium]
MATLTRTKSRLSKRRAIPRGSPDGGVTNADLLKLYYFMLETREFEDTINRLYQQGKIVGGAYSGRGNEATAVGSAYALGPEDYIFPLHRDLGAHLVRGQTVQNLMLQYLGRATGMARGHDGTGHYADPEKRIYGNISHLGAMVPVAVGVALASVLRNGRSAVMTYIGDGGVNVGEVHEALAMASVMHLPLILIIENNQYAYSTPVSKQHNVERLSDRAIGYGIPGVTIDGTDVLAVHRVSREAVERARRGGGPSIIETVTMRMRGHAAHDTAWYVPKKLLQRWEKEDPIEKFERVITAKGLLSKEKKKTIVNEIRHLVEDAARKALEEPYPPGEQAAEGVYANP